MHIALYSPSWPPAGSANGIVSYVATVKDYFACQGHQVSILSQGTLHQSNGQEVSLRSGAEELTGLRRLKHRVSGRLDGWHGALPGVGRQLAAQFKDAHRIAPIDIIEMEESFGWSDTVRRLSRIPVVTRLHGPYFLKPPTPRTTIRKLNDLQRCQKEGRAVRSSLTVTAPTRAIMQITSRQYQRIAQPSDTVIPNPIQLASQTSRWSMDRCNREEILMVGRFDYIKGADVMLLAFDRLLRSHPSARLTLVGPHIGIETMPGQMANFESFARQRLSPQAMERITLTGTLTPFEIAKLRVQASVTVVASRWENFPYALLEGLAAGSPMLSTDWPGSEEIITDGETGFLTPVGNAEAMAQRLSWILDNPETAAHIAAKGHLHCARTFTMDAVGERLLECYDATIGNFPA